MIRNPAYAGAFAYGRRQVDPAHRQPGRRATGLLYKPQEEWLALHQDAYPAYLSWEQYLTNQQRLHQNATAAFGDPHADPSHSQGEAQHGSALLQGLVVCGLCGCRMRMAYKHTPRYRCDALARRYARPVCASFSVPSVDQIVIEAFFAAVQPAQLDALEAVLSAQQAERQRLAQQWDQRLSRARYEVGLAERQYEAVDPQNRLVAAELERRWEARLSALHAVEQDFQRFQNEPSALPLSEGMRTQFRTICQTLPALWASGDLSFAQQKQLLRSLIASVILRPLAPDRVEVKIVWLSGHYSLHEARPPILREADVSGHADMVVRVGELWQAALSDPEIAKKLTAEGFRTARRLEVTWLCVQKIRLSQGWYQTLHQSRGALELAGYLTPQGLAARLGVERTWVYNRLYRGVIASQYVRRSGQGNVWLIQDDPDLLSYLRGLLPAERIPPSEGNSSLSPNRNM